MIEFTIRNTKTGEVVDGTAAYIDTELSTGPAVDNLMVKFNAAEWKQRQEFQTGDMVIEFSVVDQGPVNVIVRQSTVWQEVGSEEVFTDDEVSGLIADGTHKLVRLKGEDY